MLSDTKAEITPTGPDAIAALTGAVARAQQDDPFARVVVIADHYDAARSIRHRLGASGMINVTFQTGSRLAGELAQMAGELAQTERKPLSRLLESQAVRLVAEEQAAGFAPAGKQRFYRSLADAFRQMAERGEIPDAAGAEVSADGMNVVAEDLYDDYRNRVAERGYYLPPELPRMAADAVALLPDARRLPNVIYYLPRRMSVGDIALARSLRARDKAQIIAGRTGDADADTPVAALLERLGCDAVAAFDAAAPANPLRQRAQDDALSIISAPDPEEEVRAVIRRIAADADTPYHRVAVIYRQDNPYAALLRQEMDFASIPYSGAEYRSLGDTPTGRRLSGFAAMAAAADGVVDRERLIEWITAAPVRHPGQYWDVPATEWANMAREAHANGNPAQWQTRLNAYIQQQENRYLERYGEIPPWVEGRKRQAESLHEFVEDLSNRLSQFTRPRMDWETAAAQLADMLYAYIWYERDNPAESDDDRRRIGELAASLSGLADWDVEYRPDTLLEALADGLRSPVSSRGKPVGAGVYLGRPEGIAGADYDAVYAVGMAERQFPPSPRANPWLAENPAELREQAALERYDFLAAIAAARKAVLCWPQATADLRLAYPSRWLVEAANDLHQAHGGVNRLNYETISQGAGHQHWLTTIASRQSGLGGVTESSAMDAADYRLMHLAANPARLNDAAIADARMRRALTARNARNGDSLTEWDGLVTTDEEISRVANIGGQGNPVSPSALETWANCPYMYFLSRVLSVSAPPEDEDDELSALDRGSMVHKILERFVKESDGSRIEALLDFAEQEFANMESSGITGRYLLWEMQKEAIRSGLSNFLDAEREWFGGNAPEISDAEVDFDDVGVDVDGLAGVRFRGKIDRLDVIGGEVRVRDFKTGNPDKYRIVNRRDGTSRAEYSVANGRALQLPVYVAATQTRHQGKVVKASYCFPLSERNVHDVNPYTDADREQFHSTLRSIVNSARNGIFPATPDSEGQFSNCYWCDFNSLCPTRRRQIWERKGHDPKAQLFNQLGGRAAIGNANDDANE